MWNPPPPRRHSPRTTAPRSPLRRGGGGLRIDYPSAPACGTMSSQESGAGPSVFGGNENQEVEEEEEEYESDEPEPSAQRHRASDIWEGFWILRQHGSSTKCSACKRIRGNSGKSCASIVRFIDSTVNGSFENVNRPRLDSHAVRRATAMYVISREGDPSLLAALSIPRDRSPQRNYPRACAILVKDIMDLYGRERNTLRCIISKASGGLSFSVDHWKSDTDGKFICVTACFVDADWNLQRRVVGFRLLGFPSDAPSVAESVASCFDDLDVDKKVVGVTFDDILDDASVANSLKALLQDEGRLLFDGELCHVHCCTEILNLAVEAGLELIADVIEKIRRVIHYINHSAKRKDKFSQYARDLFHLNVTIKLHADRGFYWGHTYRMLGCALYYKDAINHFASTDKTFLSHLHIVDEEWNKVATMEKFVKVIYDITSTFLSKESKIASLYFLGVYKVYRLLDVTKGQENFMSAMVKEIKAKFDKYWSECITILACTAVLDPRYKLNLINYCFRKIYGDADASRHVDRVIALLKRLFTEYGKSSSSSSVGANVLECHTKDDLFDDYSPLQISELDWYLESPPMDLNVDLDVLKFWSGMSKWYPNLANLARDILAIPISTVSTKAAFTVGEKILSYRLSSELSSDLIEMVICLHDWTCPKDRNGIAVSPIEQYEAYEDEEDEEVFDDDNSNDAGCSGE